MSHSASLTSPSHELPHAEATEPTASEPDRDRPAEGTALARGDDLDGRRAQTRKRRSLRVRVTAKGAAYVEGLQLGCVYEAHIKPQWPDIVWPEGTGLSHTCFLFKGMYEIVEDTRPVGADGEVSALDR
jgi:hypothetical protein